MEHSVYRKIDVPGEYLKKWQKTIDLMAVLFDVPAGLLMRVSSEEIEVLIASETENNPYEPNEKADLNTGLYCEKVMATRSQLCVQNALEDDEWKNNPDVKLNMIFYLGVPLIWPDNSIFGTICVLDEKPRAFSKKYQEFLWHLKEVIERDFQLIIQDNKLKEVGIMERKQAENEIQKTRQEWEDIFQAVGHPTLILDAEHRLIHANAATEKATGKPEKDLMGKRCYELFHNTEAPPEECPVKRMTASGHFEMVEMEIEALGGSFLVSCAPMLDEKGHIEKVIHIATDITEHKRTEETLRMNEEKYRKLFQAATDAVFLSDVESLNILDANEAAVKLYGYTHDELIKQKATDLSAQPSKTEKTLKKKTPYMVPNRYHRKKDGTVFPVEIAMNRFELDDRKINISVIRDISKRIEYEKEKKILETQLLRSQKMESIGNLAGGIAHDFNNILSAIIGYTELTLDDMEKGTRAEANLQEVYTAGKRARDLVKQILAFARQSEEKTKPIRTDTITREVLRFIRSSIPTSIKINQKIESESLIMGNATQVHQVLMNLCTNAAHAMEDEGGILQVQLDDVVIEDGFSLRNPGLKPGNYLKLTVSDTGTGIAPDVVESIFEPYFTTKGPGEGTGMGLAMVHGIIEAYDGNIFVESEPGNGTVFTIYLPVTGKRKTPREYISEGLPSGTERILFVDDEAPIADMGRQTLESLGYSVTTQTSSVEALELFRTKPNHFDLVITDMTMPSITGDRLAQELMKIRPDIPVILCTGYSKKVSDENAADLGLGAFVYKPVAKVDLARTVRKVLDEAKSE